MKARNTIFRPENTYLSPRIISVVKNMVEHLVKTRQITASQYFNSKLDQLSYTKDSFLDLANIVSSEKKLYSALRVLINIDQAFILNLIKNDNPFGQNNETLLQSSKKINRSPDKEKDSDSEEEYFDDEDDEKIRLNEKNRLIEFDVYKEALTFSLALATIDVKQKSNGDQSENSINPIVKSIAYIIQKNPEWADLKIQKQYFVDAMKFIIENSQDNLMIAKLINQIDPSKKNSNFAFLHTQSGLVSRTFTSSYIAIVDCAKKQILQNAKAQDAPNEKDEAIVKAILNIETGMGKHAPDFFKHQPKHLEDYNQLLLEKRAPLSPKPTD